MVVTLIRLEDDVGRSVWVNPTHVSAISEHPYHEDGLERGQGPRVEVWIGSDSLNRLSIRGTVDGVARKLNGAED